MNAGSRRSRRRSSCWRRMRASVELVRQLHSRMALPFWHLGKQNLPLRRVGHLRLRLLRPPDLHIRGSRKRRLLTPPCILLSLQRLKQRRRPSLRRTICRLAHRQRGHHLHRSQLTGRLLCFKLLLGFLSLAHALCNRRLKLQNRHFRRVQMLVSSQKMSLSRSSNPQQQQLVR